MENFAVYTQSLQSSLLWKEGGKKQKVNSLFVVASLNMLVAWYIITLIMGNCPHDLSAL